MAFFRCGNFGKISAYIPYYSAGFGEDTRFYVVDAIRSVISTSNISCRYYISAQVISQTTIPGAGGLLIS